MRKAQLLYINPVMHQNKTSPLLPFELELHSHIILLETNRKLSKPSNCAVTPLKNGFVSVSVCSLKVEHWRGYLVLG